MKFQTSFPFSSLWSFCFSVLALLSSFWISFAWAQLLSWRFSMHLILFALLHVPPMVLHRTPPLLSKTRPGFCALALFLHRNVFSTPFKHSTEAEVTPASRFSVRNKKTTSVLTTPYSCRGNHNLLSRAGCKRCHENVWEWWTNLRLTGKQ